MFAAFRTAARTAQRAYSTAAPAGASGTEFEAARQAVADHAKHSAELWRKITCVLLLLSLETVTRSRTPSSDPGDAATPGREGGEEGAMREDPLVEGHNGRTRGVWTRTVELDRVAARCVCALSCSVDRTRSPSGDPSSQPFPRPSSADRLMSPPLPCTSTATTWPSRRVRRPSPFAQLIGGGEASQLGRRGLTPSLPSVIIGFLNAKALADEHEKHLEHIKEENGGELPERIRYVRPAGPSLASLLNCTC